MGAILKMARTLGIVTNSEPPQNLGFIKGILPTSEEEESQMNHEWNQGCEDV